MRQKPDACSGCSLEERGRGYAPAVGPTNAPILFVGEALGDTEATVGEPFVGPAGGMLNRLLTRSHWDRKAYRIDNICRCQPPKNWFDERAPWYYAARQHCTTAYLSQTLKEDHKVIVALGATAAKYLLGMDKFRLEDHHACVHETRFGFVVPTFHPSHLQRGAHNLFGCVSFDLQQAHRVAREGFIQETPDILVDPPLEWFAWWVGQVEAACAQDPEAVWLAVDIETPDKSDGQDEGELSSDDRSYTILRVNFSVHPDEGVTVPYAGGYVALIDRLLKLKCPVLGWNFEYDRPRLEAAGHKLAGTCLDFMWLAHHLQSDIPRGLGFWAPFYSAFGAWKHLAGGHPGRYAAIDGFQTYRVATGVARDLQASGQWDTAIRHIHRLHEVALKPAQQVGLLVSRERLDIFIADLEVKQRRILHTMQGMVPDAVRPLTPKGGYKREPEEGRVHSKGTELKRDGTAKKEAPDQIKQELYAQTAVLVSRQLQALVLVCRVCGAVDVQKRHRCAVGGTGGGRAGVEPDLMLEEIEATRWFWQEPFNPDSPPQILAYLAYRKHKPGRAKKTGADSTDHETLTRLFRETGDPLYKAILESRAVGKVRGTYGEGTRKLLDKDDRVHPIPTFKPSTGRLSYTSPNVTNVIQDRGDQANLASGFRHCIVAAKGCKIVEVDFSGIEAVLTGWYMRDADYIRLAKLGVHAALASHVLGKPYNPAWDTDHLRGYLKEIKKSDPVIYDRSKRTAHGTNYGLTEFGMVRNFPASFPTIAVAKRFKRIYAEMAPALVTWQNAVRERAYQQNYLGGPGDHPYGYKHWMWAVLGFRGIPEHVYRKRQKLHEPCSVIQGKYYAVVLGDDAKRAVAFYPQSTAAGVLKEAMLRLFEPDSPSYIGDAYFGKTPLRAPIHDSLLLEVPTRALDQVMERVVREMTRPIPELALDWVSLADRQRLELGSHLVIGVEAKVGDNWGDMEVVETGGLASEDVRFALDDDADNQEQFDALRVIVA